VGVEDDVGIADAFEGLSIVPWEIRVDNDFAERGKTIEMRRALELEGVIGGGDDADARGVGHGIGVYDGEWMSPTGGGRAP
jgi:hypothetical protein